LFGALGGRGAGRAFSAPPALCGVGRAPKGWAIRLSGATYAAHPPARPGVATETGNLPVSVVTLGRPGGDSAFFRRFTLSHTGLRNSLSSAEGEGNAPTPADERHTRTQHTQKTPEPLLSAYVFPIFGIRRSGSEANKKYVLYICGRAFAASRCSRVIVRLGTLANHVDFTTNMSTSSNPTCCAPCSMCVRTPGHNGQHVDFKANMSTITYPDT
jgi:hypothetical protein